MRNIILYIFFTGNAIQSCYGCVKSTSRRNKNGIFRVYTVNNDRNRHENDVYCGPSLCFVNDEAHFVRCLKMTN